MSDEPCLHCDLVALLGKLIAERRIICGREVVFRVTETLVDVITDAPLKAQDDLIAYAMAELPKMVETYRALKREDDGVGRTAGRA